MTRKITMMQAINEAMQTAMENDDKVILMGEDIAGGAKVEGFEDQDAWGAYLASRKD